MQVYLVIILLTHVTRHKALVLQQVARHESSLDALLYLVVQFLDTADAKFLTILRAPDGQRCSPETAARKVPVVEVLQPVAETSRSR